MHKETRSEILVLLETSMVPIVSGAIVSGDSKSHYHVKFDDLPAENQLVIVKRAGLLTVVAPEEEKSTQPCLLSC
jgi:hypothetical protein